MDHRKQCSCWLAAGIHEFVKFQTGPHGRKRPFGIPHAVQITQVSGILASVLPFVLCLSLKISPTDACLCDSILLTCKLHGANTRNITFIFQLKTLRIPNVHI